MALEDETGVERDRCAPSPHLSSAHTDTCTQHMRLRFMSNIKLHNVDIEQNYRCVTSCVERIRRVEDAALNTHGSIRESTRSAVSLFVLFNGAVSSFDYTALNFRILSMW
jgi:hypothetical protein